ncbi:MAG: hypothetical protein QM771_18540 [Nitrospira sp.]
MSRHRRFTMRLLAAGLLFTSLVPAVHGQEGQRRKLLPPLFPNRNNRERYVEMLSR